MTSFFETCPYCRNTPKLRPSCKNCGGNGGQYLTKVPATLAPPPEPGQEAVCAHCRQPRANHHDGRIAGRPGPFACEGLKIGFKPLEIRRG